MIRIGTVTAIGWSAVVALAWRLSDARILLCGADRDPEPPTHACIIATTTVRDNVLVWGATGLLVILVVAMFGVTARPLHSSWFRTKGTAPRTDPSETLLVE